MPSIRRVIVPSLPEPHQKIDLNETETNHVSHVLKLSDGETIEALDGEGFKANVTLRVRKNHAWVEFLEKKQEMTQAIMPVDVYQAILKSDAMEWVIEKAVELGARSFTPVVTDYCVVQIAKKGAESFTERWQKIADQALKQCGRAHRLRILAPQKLFEIDFNQKDSQFFWCYEKRENQVSLFEYLKNLEPLSVTHHYCPLIGPEGGFSEKEVEFLTHQIKSPLKPVHLGPLVLRAETAATFAMSLINGYFWKSWG